MAEPFQGKNQLIFIRDKEKGDDNFIYSTWIKGYYNGNDNVCWDCGQRFQGLFKDMPDSKFSTLYGFVVERILANPKVTVRVACLREDPDVIIGYSVTQRTQIEEDILHWVHVKTSWRKQHVATDLIPKTVKIVTHLSTVGRSLMPKAWEYNPFLT